MKDKQRKIIALFNAHQDILRAFCSQLQGCDKQDASRIPRVWLLHIWDSAPSLTNIRFNILEWILILELCYTLLQCLMLELQMWRLNVILFHAKSYNFYVQIFLLCKDRKNVFLTDIFPSPPMLTDGKWGNNRCNSSILCHIMDCYIAIKNNPTGTQIGRKQTCSTD